MLEKISKENINDDFIIQFLEKNMDKYFSQKNTSSLRVCSSFLDFQDNPIIYERILDENFIQTFLENTKYKESISIIPESVLNSKYKNTIINVVYSY